jgi:hypothetical protein
MKKVDVAGEEYVRPASDEFCHRAGRTAQEVFLCEPIRQIERVMGDDDF